MKKKIIIVALVILGALLLAQCLFAKRKLYYSSSYDLFIMTPAVKVEQGEIRIGKDIQHLDNKILFSHRGKLPVCYLMPDNDTIYVYDEAENVLNLTSDDISLLKVQQLQTACEADKSGVGNKICSSPKQLKIHIEPDYIPAVYNEQNCEISDFKRIL